VEAGHKASAENAGHDFISERETRWRECLGQIAVGDTEALARLYDESVSMLYGLAFRILGNPEDAEEAIVDVFEQVWQKAKTFNPERGSVWRWLSMITRSRALDRLRAASAQRKHEHATLADIGDVTTRDPWPDEASMFRQQQSIVREALSGLPREQREALELAYFSGLSHKEIAVALSLPLGTIKSRIRMAMEKLRYALYVFRGGQEQRA
jgi:RNA polymerase sigma-70 factor (ECF subfamily)